jgi:hypothetical protein
MVGMRCYLEREVLDQHRDLAGLGGQAMELMTDLVRQGQNSRAIRSGDPRALAHFASVLTNEYVLADLPLTREEFHAVFDGPEHAARPAPKDQPPLTIRGVRRAAPRKRRPLPRACYQKNVIEDEHEGDEPGCARNSSSGSPVIPGGTAWSSDCSRVGAAGGRRAG